MWKHLTARNFPQLEWVRSAEDVVGLGKSGSIHRRTVLSWAAGGAAAAVAGDVAALPQREVDVVVIGAGAAGIAAARLLVRAGVSTLVVEAENRRGGRCVTDTLTFSAPFDRGAHWLHAGDQNPLVKLGRDLGFDIYTDPGHTRLMIGDRVAAPNEMQAYQQAVRGAEEAIVRYIDGRQEDVAAVQGLPRDLGDWRDSVRFRLGPLDCGKILAEISAQDFARAPSGDDLFCRAGFGTLLATLGRGLPSSLGTPVTAITVENGAVRVDTPRGNLRAKAAIVTVSTAVLASGLIKFTPELPDSIRTAAEGLKLGSYLHVGLEIPGNPLGLEPDTAIYVKSDEARAFSALAQAGGSDLWYVDTGGIYARELEAAGAATAVAVALDWLVAHFGSDIRTRVARAVATGWGLEPHVGGAWSVASPGRAGARAALRQPHADRVFLAGEACHDVLWGTVAGAWETGEAAARETLKLVRA